MDKYEVVKQRVCNLMMALELTHFKRLEVQ